MNSVSVYTSLFNYSPDKFDLTGAFSNWSNYADEIVIGTFKSQKQYLYHVIDDLESKSKAADFCFIKVVECDTSLEDPLFDGKVKNAALQECSNDIVIQQDMDERLGGKKEVWEGLFNYLSEPLEWEIDKIKMFMYNNTGFMHRILNKNSRTLEVKNYLESEMRKDEEDNERVQLEGCHA